MQKIPLALLALALLSCGLWQPYAAMQAPQPTQAATRTPGGATSWATPTPIPQLCTVTADFLNVRSGPGKRYPAISWLRSGEVVTILDLSGAWLQTPAGWIHSNYCKGQKK